MRETWDTNVTGRGVIIAKNADPEAKYTFFKTMINKEASDVVDENKEEIVSRQKGGFGHIDDVHFGSIVLEEYLGALKKHFGDDYNYYPTEKGSDGWLKYNSPVVSSLKLA